MPNIVFEMLQQGYSKMSAKGTHTESAIAIEFRKAVALHSPALAHPI
jgi:hypothetical protein